MKEMQMTSLCPHCKRRFKPPGLAAHLAARVVSGGRCAPPKAEQSKQERKKRRSTTYLQDYLSTKQQWSMIEDVSHMT